jgi:hypothetical protein
MTLFIEFKVSSGAKSTRKVNPQREAAPEENAQGT